MFLWAQDTVWFRPGLTAMWGTVEEKIDCLLYMWDKKGIMRHFVDVLWGIMVCSW